MSVQLELHGVIKTLNELGYNVGDCRLPLYKMSEANIEKLKQSLDC